MTTPPHEEGTPQSGGGRHETDCHSKQSRRSSPDEDPESEESEFDPCPWGRLVLYVPQPELGSEEDSRRQEELERHSRKYPMPSSTPPVRKTSQEELERWFGTKP